MPHFEDRGAQPAVTHLRVKRVVGLGLAVLALLVLASLWLLRPSSAVVEQATPETTGWPAWMQRALVYEPAAPQASVPPQPAATGVPVTLPQVPQPPASLPAPQEEPDGPPLRRVAASGVSPARTPRVRKWLFAEMQTVSRRPFQDASPQGGPSSLPARQDMPGAAPGPAAAAALIPQARWEEPADPTQVLYPSQIIQAQLVQDVVSTIPGEIRLMVVQDVQDKWFQGTVLLPRYTYLIGHQEGTPTYGQNRLAITLRAAELPSGRMLDFTTAVAQDGTGQAGLAGTTNHHYVQLGIAAVLTALMSTGTQAVVDHRGTYRPSFEEELASNLGTSINRTGQAIVRRELERPPTITLRHGTPATVQLREAISLQTAPVLVER
jgi:type IV secretory pathway VirB10-like protein